MATPTNLNIYAGDDYAADITVLNPDGTDADLTGYTAQSQIRTSLSDTSPDGVAQFATSIAANVVTITLDHDVSKTLTRSVYFWDLQVIDETGWITTLVAGQIFVTKEVTKVYSSGMLAHA